MIEKIDAGTAIRLLDAGKAVAVDVRELDALGYSNLYDLGGILSWPYEIEGDFEGHF